VNTPARVLTQQLDAAPWVVLPTDHQAVIIGELSRFAGDDWHLSIDPTRTPADGLCAHDYGHGDGLIQVNDGFPLCVGCARKLLSYLCLPGERIEVTVLREATP